MYTIIGFCQNRVHSFYFSASGAALKNFGNLNSTVTTSHGERGPHESHFSRIKYAGDGMVAISNELYPRD